jgi:hypothetical protein
MGLALKLLGLAGIAAALALVWVKARAAVSTGKMARRLAKDAEEAEREREKLEATGPDYRERTDAERKRGLDDIGTAGPTAGD